MEARLALLFLLLVAQFSSEAEAGRLLKPEDFAAIRDVDEPDLSPDGQSVVYVVGTIDLKKDKQAKNLWLAKCDSARKSAAHFRRKSTRHIHAGVRTANGSPFFPAEWMKTRMINSGFFPARVAKPNN